MFCLLGGRTLSRGIRLHEALAGAHILELGGQPRELGQVLVDEADFRGELVVVDVLCEEASGVACGCGFASARGAVAPSTQHPAAAAAGGVSG